MKEQRTRAKADAQSKKTGHADVSAYRAVLDAVGATTFTGYTGVEAEATIASLLVGGSPARSAGEGAEVDIVLDRTPFYAEGGGQLADTGRLVLASGAQIEVLDVQKPLGGLVIHRARVLSGEIVVGAGAHALVDVERRRAISRAHTATHLIHRAIRGALGESAAQAGSLNAPGRLRFDFSSPAGVPASVLTDVEDEVNSALLADLEVRAFVTTQDEARRIGAMALFGEKYGDEVRVVEVGDYARELCGGTHAARSGQLGLVKILSEASIGAGVRRVEALVGLDAFRFLAKEHVLVNQLADALKAPAAELPERVAALTSRLKDAERELDKLRGQAILSAAPELAAGAVQVGGVALVAADAGSVAADGLRALALDVRGRLDASRPGVVAMVGVAGDRPSIVVAVNDAARAAGIRAGELVKVAAVPLGGRGGGKDDFAQGGGTDPAGAPAALAAVRAALEPTG
jgi:alanyl-tRNA synthetase